jgi:hypothetical protein
LVFGIFSSEKKCRKKRVGERKTVTAYGSKQPNFFPSNSAPQKTWAHND